MFCWFFLVTDAVASGIGQLHVHYYVVQPVGFKEYGLAYIYFDNTEVGGQVCIRSIVCDSVDGFVKRCAVEVEIVHLYHVQHGVAYHCADDVNPVVLVCHNQLFCHIVPCYVFYVCVTQSLQFTVCCDALVVWLIEIEGTRCQHPERVFVLFGYFRWCGIRQVC